jgi:cytochrome c oxidase subunit 2
VNESTPSGGAEPDPPRAKTSLRRRVLKRAAGAAGLLGGAVLLSSCTVPTFGAYRGATVQGHDEFKLWLLLVFMSIPVLVIVWGLTAWTVARYGRRRKGNDKIPKQFQQHIPIELAYTIIPIIMVAVIFYFTVVTENEVDAVASHPAVVVDTLAYQWGWRFHYQSTPVTVETVGPPTLLAGLPENPRYPQLVLPVDETTRIVLRSNDVVHGFYVAAFNFSRYALPGVTNVFDLTPTKLGVFPGRCTQFCGLYHSEMLFSVRVVPDATFRHWITSHPQLNGRPS